VLGAHPRRTEEWCEFRSRELSRYMHAWLRAHGFVIPRDAPPPPAPAIDPVERSEPPSPRRLQLDAVLEELTAPDLESLLALAELLHLDACARRDAG
jgi:hypothetical protein